MDYLTGHGSSKIAQRVKLSGIRKHIEKRRLLYFLASFCLLFYSYVQPCLANVFKASASSKAPQYSSTSQASRSD